MKSISHGPVDTTVDGVTSVSLTGPPLNYDADYRVIEEGPGKVVYTHVKSPADRPSTLRIAQTSKANVYAGSTIDPSVYLPSKRGLDTIIEVREVWAVTDSADAAFLQYAPVRAALTLSLPDSGVITADDILLLVKRVTAALFDQGEITAEPCVTALQRGVVQKA